MTCALALCLAAPSGVWADATLVFEEGDGRGHHTLNDPMYISGGKIRLGNRVGDGEYVIFDAQARTMTVVDQHDRSFMQMDESAFDEMSEAVREATRRALSQLEEQLKDLPAAEQIEMRRALQSSLPTLGQDDRAAAAVRQVATGQKVEVNGYRCEVIEVHRGPAKSSQLCVVSRADLGIGAQDYATLRKFQAFMADVAAKLPGSTNKGFELGDPAREHIPVQVVVPDPEKEGGAIVTRLARVFRTPIEGSIFRVPDGFEQRDFRTLLQP